MYIAINKRKENIAEYILYLWQLEDLLRALQFSPEAIFSQLVAPRNLKEDEQLKLLEWYMDVVNLMESEGKAETGHLEHTIHLISDLQQLHLQLMELPVGERYRELFARLQPELPRLRGILTGSDRLDAGEMSDMELCFRALYAVMLYRIKGEEKADDTIQDVLETVSPVIAELADIYRKAEQGEVDLFQGAGGGG